jgi:predicted CopG family antitoxin
MGVADEQIRVSSGVKHELERRKRAGESYSEVLERLLDDRTASFEAGFGRWSDGQAKRVREGRQRAKEKRKRRTERERSR